MLINCHTAKSDVQTEALFKQERVLWYPEVSWMHCGITFYGFGPTLSDADVLSSFGGFVHTGIKTNTINSGVKWL